MIDDAFHRERESIRAKMLKYSRAINEGKSTDEILADDEKASVGDDVLKKRFERDKNSGAKKEKIYLKKDLIDVKLEEKTSLAKRLFAKFKRQKPKADDGKTKQAAVKKQGLSSKESKAGRLDLFLRDLESAKRQANKMAENLAQGDLKKETSANATLKKEAGANALNSSVAPSKELNSKNLNLARNSALNSANLNRSNLSTLPSKNLNLNLNSKPHSNPLNSSILNLKKQNELNSTSPNPLNSSILASNELPSNALNSTLQKDGQIQLKIPDEDSIKVKNTLLQGHSKATQDEKNLGKNQLLFAALCIVFALVVFVPKIYITSNIYYISRDIATLRTQESILSEENKELNKRLENMRFQNQILDYLE